MQNSQQLGKHSSIEIKMIQLKSAEKQHLKRKKMKVSEYKQDVCGVDTDIIHCKLRN